MSRGESTPLGGDGQDDLSEKRIQEREANAAEAAAELKRAELQLALGFITRRSLMRIAGVGNDAIQLLEKQGLRLFRNGTSEAWCKRPDLEAFIAALDAPRPKGKK